MVLWVYEREAHRLTWEVRDFAAAARLIDPYSLDCQDDELVDIVRTAIKHGSLVGVTEGEAASFKGDQTMAERHLVRSIDKRAHGRLSDGGRQYKLVAGQDLLRGDQRGPKQRLIQKPVVRVAVQARAGVVSMQRDDSVELPGLQLCLENLHLGLGRLAPELSVEILACDVVARVVLIAGRICDRIDMEFVSTRP